MNLLLEAQTTQGQTGSMISTIVMFVAVIAFFYFIILRPQKKQEKQMKQMLDNLAPGDLITTIGGIVGEVVSIKDDTVLIETSRDRTRLRMLKSAVKAVNTPETASSTEEKK